MSSFFSRIPGFSHKKRKSQCSRPGTASSDAPPAANGFQPEIKSDAPPVAGPSSASADCPIDDYRPMKVVCIGAGYSGIIAAIRFSQKVPNLDLKVYEKEKGIGGTWLVNKYPGLACDIPSHTYQLTFEPNTSWSGFYAPGPEILAYLQGVVEKYKLMKYIHLEHELVHARWDAPTHQWHLRIRHGEEEFEDTTDVFFLGTGGLHRWRWPNIEGLKEFGGRVLHTAQWDVTEGAWQEGVKDWGDKNVGVIGNGASGIQVVSALQPKVKSLTNFIRGRTWISVSFAVPKLFELLGREAQSTDYSFTDEHREAFKDPAYYEKFRHTVESDLNSATSASIRGSPMQLAVKEAFAAEMAKRTASKPELAEKIVPEFAVGCRRLTPGPGYLEALCEPNATLENTPIKRVVPTGVELTDGRIVPLDVLVCATGFDTTYHYPFEVVGLDGLKLNDRWKDHAEAYITVAVDGFPNLFFGLGPNSGLNSGSLLVVIEKQVEYAVQAAAKLQRERLASIVVKKEAVADWAAYMRGYFPKTVYSEGCNTWYQVEDGTIVGLWPGSCLHAVRTLSHPRWEDFDYTPLDKTTSRLYWLGDGQTYNEKTMTGDRAWYLNEIDYPPVPQE
ncbi:FAD/NAD-P-binding domain-containing protein [Amylostereum chailletii]|nr:FAD/NAD-P-binding domain-containing protein [Amylostereum chailletii]